MNPLRQTRPLLLSVLIGICPPSFGKDYIIEMIFFADQQQAAANTVHPSARPVTPPLRDAVLLDDNAATYGFTLLPPQALTLTSQAAALEKTGRYRILRHIAWRQPGLAERQARAVRIYAGKNYSDELKTNETNAPPLPRVATDETALIPSSGANPSSNELDGTVKVILGRYLHIYTNLVYRRPYYDDYDSTDYDSGHYDSPDYDGASDDTHTFPRQRVLAEFAINIHRKMRSEELHYLDHPLLGILTTIRPVEAPD